MLSGKEIRDKQLIANGLDDGYRAASYDLHIGEIVSPSKDPSVIPAQGIVTVISGETVTLPNDITGFALVKTGLCNEGVLAINIGIIDAGWSGPIKTLLINFGKNPYPLALGEAFLRLTFFQHQAGGGRLGGPIERSAYVQEARRSMLQLFSETFLDIETSAKKASEKTMEDFKLILFKYVPIAALLITLITFVLNYGSLWLLPRFFQPADISRAAGLEKSVEKLLDE